MRDLVIKLGLWLPQTFDLRGSFILPSQVQLRNQFADLLIFNRILHPVIERSGLGRDRFQGIAERKLQLQVKVGD